MLLIVWYPFLCCWPSGIVLYILCNAILTAIQGTIMRSMWFSTKLNKKIAHYQMILAIAEYDKGTSQSIVEGIKSGE
jgi:membrane protein insertase Oxa1/YidC/SpoIIIJ